MKSGDLPSVHGPSPAEVCAWLELAPGTRGHWVDRGLVRDADPMDRAAIVELFVVNELTQVLKPKALLNAWTRVSDQVIRLEKAPRRLDLVWIDTPPSAHLIRSNNELAAVALRKPRRLIVVPLAEPIGEAIKSLNDYLEVAFKSESAARDAQLRKGSKLRRHRQHLKVLPLGG
jgi:hypothetical protein